MSKIKSPEPSWKTSALYSRLEKVDSVLLNGRKWFLIGSCCLPVLSVISTNISTVLKIVIVITGLATVVAHSIFEKHENVKGVAVCNKIMTYCFTSGAGLALSLELLDVASPLITVICGVAVSVFFSAMMYKVIER